MKAYRQDFIAIATPAIPLGLGWLT